MALDPERTLGGQTLPVGKAEVAAPMIQSQVKGGRPFAKLPKNKLASTTSINYRCGYLQR